MSPEQILDISRECAASVYGHRPPSAQYAERAAMLLAGTCATESACVDVRQHGYSWDIDLGAWGLWQSEKPAMFDNLIYLTSNNVLCARGMKFAEIEWTALQRMGGSSILRCVAASPRLACLMARVHYLRRPEPIPASVDAQARYWKKWYNTAKGKGTPEKYMRDFDRLIRPLIEGQLA